MIFQSHAKLLELVNEKAFELEVQKLFSEHAFSYVCLHWFIRKMDPERNEMKWNFHEYKHLHFAYIGDQ